MEVAIIILCLLAILYANNKYEHFYNPISSFCIVWVIIVAFATMQLFGLNETSQKAYNIVFWGILSFILGSSVGLNKKFVFGSIGRNSKFVYDSGLWLEKTYILNTRSVWFFAIVTLVVLLIQFSSVALLYLQSFSMHDVRVIYASVNYALESGNVVLSVLNSYVARPFEIAIMPLSAIALFQEKRKNWKLFAVGIIIIFLQIIVDAGRAGVVQWLFCVGFIYIFSAQQQFYGKISQKTKLQIILLGIMCFMILTYLSSLREIDDTTSSFYTYICGCMPYMDIRLDTVDSSGIMTYGASALFGISSILSWLLSIIGIYPDFLTTVTKMASVQEYYFIGSKIEFNSFVTPFYHLYIDGRLLGVIIGMLLYGYFSGRSYTEMVRNTNSKTTYIYTIVLLGILFSMIRFPFVKTNYILALCYLPLFFKKHISDRDISK